jgi:hypothetical protein
VTKNITFAGIASSALAAITIGLAAPAVALPSGNGHDGSGNPAYPTSGQNPYDTYQSPHKSG